MMTSRTTPLSPSRRGKVAWTQHTSYPAAAGVHSEVSPTARSLHVTGRHQLQADLTNLQSLHHKELRRLHRQRKALQASMLAYAHKMREISSGRLLVNSPTLHHNPGRAQSDGAPVQRKAGRSSVTDKTQIHTNTGQCDADRILTRSQTGELEGKRTEIRPRISVDSGIDVTEAWVEEPDRETTHRASLPTLKSLSAEPVYKPRPASFHTGEHKEGPEDPQQTEYDRLMDKRRPASFHVRDTLEFCGESVRNSNSETMGFKTSSKFRQRRPGTSENPNMLFQKINVRDSHYDREDHGLDKLEFLSSLPEAANMFPSISPFPEFSEASKIEEAETGKSGIPAESKNQTQVPSPIPLSPLKLKKSKELYWNLRKIQTKRRFPARSSKSFSKRLRHPSSLSPRQTGFRSFGKAKDKPQPTKDTFHHSFRYSDAVESLLKSFEDCRLDRIGQHHIRKAAELLPALDIEDLRQERTKQKQQKKKNSKFVQASEPSSGIVYPSAHRNDDRYDDRGDRVDESCDVRSDYGSDDGSVDSFVSSQGNGSDQESITPREEAIS